MTEKAWWRGAVIYQVYPRSLMDANNDGVGDLRGIINKLDYIASLNVDAIWISPFFKSPMKDFGYDISDYRQVDPMFGNETDIDELIAEAHQRNIKVIIDQVLSHTSDQHEWFIESREDKTNPKADWYVWADSKPDGMQPNNWLSIFGGPAWQWEPRRKQYYMHNFLTRQPDLNYHNPDVQQAVLDNVEFWLKKGVDGLRLDAITYCFHDKLLRDNPPKAEEDRVGRGFSPDNPYAFQYHYYNNALPENIGFIERLRSLMDKYPGTVTLGEVTSEDSLATMAEYTEGNNRLHMCYSFELLTDDYSADYIRSTVATLEQQMQQGWSCWAIGNHDVQRVVTRWGKGKGNAQMAKMLNAMLFSLRGSVCSYQGEELGLTEVDIQEHELQDPYGITFWPRFKGRDGCRTPLPWDNEAENAGFSQHKTWLPIPPEHKALAVSTQESNPESILHAYRAFLAWRRQHGAMRDGDIRFIDTPEPLLQFERQQDSEHFMLCFNLGDTSQQIMLEQNWQIIEPVAGMQAQWANRTGEQVNLPAYGVMIAKR